MHLSFWEAFYYSFESKVELVWLKQLSCRVISCSKHGLRVTGLAYKKMAQETPIIRLLQWWALIKDSKNVNK